jgi:hypothetical protein
MLVLLLMLRGTQHFRANTSITRGSASQASAETAQTSITPIVEIVFASWEILTNRRMEDGCELFILWYMKND